MTTNLAQCLVAYAGESLACPDCGVELGVFDEDVYAAGPPWPLTFERQPCFVSQGGLPVLVCDVCGGLPVASDDPIEALRPIVSSTNPRIHLSTGWRWLTGE